MKAKALGLTIPPEILLQATTVIESQPSRTQSKRRLIASCVEMEPKEPKFCCSIFATQV